MRASVVRFLLVTLLLVPAWADAGLHPSIEGRPGCVSTSCHADFQAIPGPAGSLHQPAREGDCASCHDLSLEADRKFVRGAAATGAGRSWDVPLCSACHEGVARAGQDSPGGTGFADGKRNLHVLHVRSAQGRGCITCHDAHRAAQPHLLRTEIPTRGSARIAQRFREQNRGGWCQTGCHAPKTYVRGDAGGR